MCTHARTRTPRRSFDNNHAAEEVRDQQKLDPAAISGNEKLRNKRRIEKSLKENRSEFKHKREKREKNIHTGILGHSPALRLAVCTSGTHAGLE